MGDGNGGTGGDEGVGEGGVICKEGGEEFDGLWARKRMTQSES